MAGQELQERLQAEQARRTVDGSALIMT